MHDLPDANVAAPTETLDGIAVFTGGELRIEMAAQMLKAGKVKTMFISGVDAGTRRRELQALLQPILDEASFACCVRLGRSARDTYGNARETAAWARREKIDSLYLATSFYHMPRSLLLLADELDDRRIVPYPVASNRIKLSGWWQRPGTLRLMAEEYSKYLVVLGRRLAETLGQRLEGG